MGQNVGGISFDLICDGSKLMTSINSYCEKVKGKFGKSFADISKQSKTTADAITNNFSNSFSSIAKKAIIAFSTIFGVKQLVSFGKACIELGSDLQEVQNVVDVTFPAMQAQINKFAQDAAASFGLSETMAKQFAGTFGSMAKAFGFAENDAYDMATALTGLAGDVASFYNITQDEAYTKLKSVFTGETESLKDLGVVMTQTALDSYALANGFGKTTAQMTEAEKVALRYKFVQEQLALASGDFIRTSDGWANQVRVLKLQFDSLKATIGQGLINVLTPVIKVINTLVGKLMTLANAFKSFTEMITGKKGSSDATAQMQSTAQAANQAAAATEAVGNAAAKSAKKMNGLFAFDKMNVANSASEDSESSGETQNSAGGYLSDSFDMGTIDTTGIDTADEKLQTLFQGIREAVKPTTEAFRQLWEQGLSKLGTFTAKGLKDFYEGFLLPIGKWTLGEGIPRFVSALNDGLMKIDFDKINVSLSKLWDAIEPYEENIGEGLLWLWENVLVPFGTWTANNAVPAFIDMVREAIEVANDVTESARPALQWFWDELLQPLSKWAGEIFIEAMITITDLLEKFGDWISEHQQVIEVITIVVASLAAAFDLVNIAIGIWNVVGAIATGVTTAFGVAVAFLTSPIGLAIAAIAAIIAIGVLLYKNWDTIKEKAQELWDKFVEAFNGIKQNVSEKITAVRDTISDTIDNIKTGITQKLNIIKMAFTATFSAIKRTVTSIITDTWSAIKKVINSIITGVEVMANGIVRALNTAIAALNKISFSIPDWVPELGGKSFGFSIPTIQSVSIPRLAAGGYVKANTPQLAMIGDNRHQGEIVAPEDKIYQVSSQAMVDVMKQFMSALVATGNRQNEIKIVIKVTGEMAPFVRMLKTELDKEQTRAGVSFEVVYE